MLCFVLQNLFSNLFYTGCNFVVSVCGEMNGSREIDSLRELDRLFKEACIESDRND